MDAAASPRLHAIWEEIGDAIAHKQPVYGDRKICNQPTIFGCRTPTGVLQGVRAEKGRSGGDRVGDRGGDAYCCKFQSSAIINIQD
ncbi:MAG: hypothetical protein EBE86_019020 [Hormoscilla sp. GUM202]|nr:hypothetical protein [Hormoscilla sp. GUM202]